jgi:hypothetical protein
MGQTENGMTFISALLFVSPDGSTWTDVSGHGASVAVSEGERMVAEQHTFSGDTPIVEGGKRKKTKVTGRYVYTEEDGDPFEVLRTQHETEKGPIYVQYSPQDGFWYKTGLGVLEKPGYPGGDAKSDSIIMSEFVVSCASLTKATAST